MSEVRAILELFDATTAHGERCALATVVSVDGSSYRQPGARMLVTASGKRTGTISAGCLESDVAEHAKRAMRTGATALVEYNTASASEDEAWGLGLGCSGIVRVLVEPLTGDSAHINALRRSLERPVRFALPYGENGTFEEILLPPVSLAIFGAGADVLPVVEFAQRLGWRTQVIDPQARIASRSRFAIADLVTLARPEEIAQQVDITSRTVTLLMTHNYTHDVTLLRFLLASSAPYIGVMGARERMARMLEELSATGEPRLYAPVGLDIGANTPAEIALTVIAEIRAVLAGRSGGMLRDREGSIHSTDRDAAHGGVTRRGVAPVVAA